MVAKYKARNEVRVKEDSRGYLQYQIPALYAMPIYGKKQKYISFGAKNDWDTLTEAQAKLKILVADLEEGRFNPANIVQYRHSKKQVRPNYERYKKVEVDATMLFDDYQKYRFASQENDVGIDNYKTFFNAIRNSPCQDVTTNQGQRAMVDFVCGNSGFKVVKNTLSIMDKAIRRGIEKEILPKNNPNIFKQCQLEFLKNNKQVKREYPLILTKRGFFKDHDKIAWTKEEMAIIIKAFRDRYKWSPYYKKCDIKTLVIEFCFYTGVRHGEAYGLKWGVLSEELSVAVIRQAFSSGTRVQKSTKNEKIRKIRLNSNAQNILIKVRDFYKEFNIKMDNNSYVFLKENQTPFTNADFNLLWRGQNESKKVKEKIGVVTKLFLDKKISAYIDMYSTRRTYASLMAQGAFHPPGVRTPDPATVAEYIGDNVQTVIEHYYSGQENYAPPTFDLNL